MKRIEYLKIYRLSLCIELKNRTDVLVKILLFFKIIKYTIETLKLTQSQP